MTQLPPFPGLTAPQSFQDNVDIRYPPMSGLLADNGGRVYGAATTNTQSYGSASEANAPSDCLKGFARRCILDPSARIDILHMESSGGGRLKVTVTFDVADTI